MKPRTTCYLLGALLLLLVIGTFLPATRNGFITVFDDNGYITENSHVQQGLTLSNLGWALTTSAAANWHPLTWISHMLDWQLFGSRAWGHHLTSVLFHAANTWLLFLLLHRMTGSIWRSFFVAALFGVHPLRVESVAWIAERKDVLSVLFFLLTLGAYARYTRQSAVHGPQSTVHSPQSITPPQNVEVAGAALATKDQESGIKNSKALSYCVALLFFVLGLLSKPMLVTAPFVLLLLDYWPLRRVSADASPGARSKVWLRLLVEKLPFLILAALASVATFIAQRHGGAVWSVERLPLSDRLGNAVVAYVRYPVKLFWPTQLAVFYPHPGSWPFSTVMLALLLLLALTALVWIGRRRAPYLPVGWLWYVGTLVPVIGVVQVGWQSIADRYTYIPCIGVLVIVVWGAQALVTRILNTSLYRRAVSPTQDNSTSSELAPPRWPGLALGLTGAALVLVCAGLTWQDIGYWKDGETLFRRTLAVTKYNYVAHYNLGIALLGQGRVDEAVAQLQIAHKLRPTTVSACNALGEALLRQGHFEEALDMLHQAVALEPDSAVARNKLGVELIRKGALDQAIAEFREALKAKPDYAKAHVNLGMALSAQGHLDLATDELRKAVQLAPQDAETRNNLGMVLGRSGHLDEAIQQLEEAVRLDPVNPQAHHNLGLALTRLGRPAEALRQFELALELKSDSPETHASIATVLVQLGRKPEAIRHLNLALQLRPDYPQAAQQLRALTPEAGTP